jgi:hypothetical protein
MQRKKDTRGLDQARFQFPPLGLQKKERAGENVVNVTEDKLVREFFPWLSERKIGLLC